MEVREGMMVRTRRGAVGMVKSVRDVNEMRFYGIQQYYHMSSGWIPTGARKFAAHSEIVLTEAAQAVGSAVAEPTAA